MEAIIEPRRLLLKGANWVEDDAMAETLLDVKGMTCPLPVLRANRALRGLAAGDRLRVLVTDRASVADFQIYCRESGHALLSWSEDTGVFHFVIRKKAEAAEPEAGAA